jgi:hypothetical protein
VVILAVAGGDEFAVGGGEGLHGGAFQ